MTNYIIFNLSHMEMEDFYGEMEETFVINLLLIVVVINP